MDFGLYECYQGLKSRSDMLDLIGNNLANLNTTGFKADQSFFHMVRQSVLGGSGDQAECVLPGSFTDFQDGSLSPTSSPLDLALEGKGFFCVKTPSGLAYTRNGSFHLDAEGYLLTGDGYRVQGVDGDILLDRAGTVQVDKLGNIQVDQVSMGILKIVDFADYSRLEKTGNSMFRPVVPEMTEQAADRFTLLQGYRENANLNPASAMTAMVGVLRQFEMLQKAMNSLVNDLDKKVIEQVGRVKP